MKFPSPFSIVLVSFLVEYYAYSQFQRSVQAVTVSTEDRPIDLCVQVFNFLLLFWTLYVFLHLTFRISQVVINLLDSEMYVAVNVGHSRKCSYRTFQDTQRFYLLGYVIKISCLEIKLQWLVTLDC